MDHAYKVAAFYPTFKGCGATDKGWNVERCNQYQSFLTENATDGWRFHSSEYRDVTATRGCESTRGAVLICVFERDRA
jgi:hypothetical protein